MKNISNDIGHGIIGNIHEVLYKKAEDVLPAYNIFITNVLPNTNADGILNSIYSNARTTKVYQDTFITSQIKSQSK